METNRGNSIAIVTLIIGIVIVVGWFMWGRSSVDTSSSSPETSTAVINGNTFNLEIADTEGARELGLGGRSSLPQNSGMLFVFDVPNKYEFWMKDMQFPLDMIWLDPNLKIVHIEKNISPSTYPDTTFKSDEDALYVLEVNAGFADKNNLKVGDAVEVNLKK